MDKILLIDFHNAVWRATISFSKPTNHEICLDEGHSDKHPNDNHCKCGAYFSIEDNICYGEKYLTVYNFFRNIRPIIEQFSPDKCFFVLEGHPQFRYDLFADYKANRIHKTASKKETVDKFHESKREIIRLIKYLPITVARAENYECDDVIATLSENLKEEDVTILSNDSDFIQLLQKGYKSIKIYNPIKKEFMESPEYPYVAWKCLAGDKSDNIPALLKPKKALEHSTNPKLFEKFLSTEENRANFNINRQLIEFKMVPEDDINLIEGSSNFSELKNEFIKMKFNSIINDKSWEKYCNTFSCLKY